MDKNRKLKEVVEDEKRYRKEMTQIVKEINKEIMKKEEKAKKLSKKVQILEDKCKKNITKNDKFTFNTNNEILNKEEVSELIENNNRKIVEKEQNQKKLRHKIKSLKDAYKEIIAENANLPLDQSKKLPESEEISRKINKQREKKRKLRNKIKILEDRNKKMIAQNDKLMMDQTKQITQKKETAVVSQESSRNLMENEQKIKTFIVEIENLEDKYDKANKENIKLKQREDNLRQNNHNQRQNERFRCQQIAERLKVRQY